MGLHVLPGVGRVLLRQLRRLGHLLLRGRLLRRGRHLPPLLVVRLRRLPYSYEPHLGFYIEDYRLGSISTSSLTLVDVRIAIKLYFKTQNRFGRFNILQQVDFLSPDGTPLVFTHQVTEECIGVGSLGALPVELGALLVQRLAAVGLLPQRVHLDPGSVGEVLQRRVLGQLVTLLIGWYSRLS